MGRKAIEAAAILVETYELPLKPEEVVEKLHHGVSPEVWHSAKLMPGAGEIVDYFSANNIPICIATGSDNAQLERKLLNHKELRSKMHHIVPSGGNPKVS